MKTPLPATSQAIPIQADQFVQFAATVVATTTSVGLGWRKGVPILQPVIRLLSGILLLCWVANASAELLPTPIQVDFHEHAVGITSDPLATTLLNTGNQSLTVAAVSAATGVYARAGGSCGAPPFTIAAQASCTIQHTFTANALTLFYQTITLTLAGGDSVPFGLRGEGAQGHLTIDPLFGLSWWPIPVGTIGEEKIVVLGNDGPVPIHVHDIVTSSVPATSAFVRTGGDCPAPPFEIDFGGCYIAYVFVPAQVGESTMDVIFHTEVSNFPLSLRGEGSAEIPLFKNGFD